ncbi:CbtB-domain containing protein [Streptomyces sp. NPDC127068]|uniref:CbtB domain-containing protein n=1 Tax=Streptomyces sp. NPDC127068 TaxID=3347127 RepID=UPI003664EB9C
MAQSVAQPTAAPTAPPAKLPLKDIAPWAVFGGVLMLILLYFIGAEQGAVALVSGEGVHEWVHDARHLLGYPCH